LSSSDVGLVAATAVHAGFQLVVTVLVYPGFATVPSEAWAAHHAAHGRRITSLVAVVYTGVIVASGAALLRGPSPAQVLSVAASAVALVVTAVVAAPTHRRLAVARDPRVLRRLLTADRVRCAAALAAAGAAVAGAVG